MFNRFRRVRRSRALSQVGRLSAWAIRPVQPVMLSRRLSAAGFRLLGHLLPAEDFRPPCGRPTGSRRTSSGLSRSAPVETRTGWVPSILRGRGVPTEFQGENSVRDPKLPYQPSIRQPSMTEPQRRFTCVHPSVLSLARIAKMVPAPLGLHLLLHTRLTRSQPRMQRLGTGCGHLPGPCGHSTGATSCRAPTFELYRSTRRNTIRTRTSARRRPVARWAEAGG